MTALAILWPLAIALMITAAGARAARAVALAGMAGGVLLAIPLAWTVAHDGRVVVEAGGWPPPLGIVLVADGLGAALMLVIAIVVAIVGATIPEHVARPHQARWFALWFVVWAALNALVLSHDLFNLYVTLELVTLAAIGLIPLGGRRDAAPAALRYMLLALPGSLLYLLGVALLYVAHDTLDLALLADRMSAQPLTAAALALLFAGLALKAALAPLHAWLPSVYAAAHPVVAALLAGLVGKAPFLIALKVWQAGLPPSFAEHAGWIFGALGATAIVWCSALALRHVRLRGVLAYSSVAHTGYLFVWLAFATAGAWHGAVYVAVAHALAIASLFLVVLGIEAATGSDDLDGVRGLSTTRPRAFFALALAAVSIMGMPPSGGFVGKWLMLMAAVQAEQWWAVLALIAGSLLAAGYMFRVLRLAFLPGPAGTAVRATHPRTEIAALVLAFASIVVGLVPALGRALLASGGPR